MTYVICRSVGFTADEALIAAAADQGMDDSSGTAANGGIGGAIPNVAEEWKWHAFDGYGWTDGGSMTVNSAVFDRFGFNGGAIKTFAGAVGRHTGRAEHILNLGAPASCPQNAIRNTFVSFCVLRTR